MPKLYLLLVLICVGQLSYAQPRLGLLGGPQTASVKEQNNIPGWEKDIKPLYSSRPGLNLGLMVEAPLTAKSKYGWYFQSGIIYSSKGRKYFSFNDSTSSAVSDTISSAVDLSFNYIEFPLNLAYKFQLSTKIKFFVSAGPYFGFFYNGKQRYETRVYSSNAIKNETIDVEVGNEEEKVKTLDAGYNVRTGLEIGNVMISGFMSNGLKNFYTASYEGNFKHRVRGLSVGFWINPAKPQKKKVTTPVTQLDTAMRQVPEAEEVEEAPKDSDLDGIADNADRCPDKFGTAEFYGCPVPDSDNDGLNDKDDQCPHQAGAKGNNGCPVPDSINLEVEELVKFAARKIMFNASSDELAESSYESLDQIADLLKANPSYRMLIEGHTDMSGRAEENKILSQKRAESVKKYLISKGVFAARLMALGFGSERPLVSNKTAEGRTMNRRVELRFAK